LAELVGIVGTDRDSARQIYQDRSDWVVGQLVVGSARLLAFAWIFVCALVIAARAEFCVAKFEKARYKTLS
jgi:hypothetical protein